MLKQNKFLKWAIKSGIARANRWVALWEANMDLSREISGELYRVVWEKYARGQYRDAVLAAVFYLEKQVTEKARLGVQDLDITSYTQVVGQAFGSPDPIIQLSRVSTVAQVYEQKGLEQLLLGIHHGIRNPRIHAALADDERSARTIILFIDYLSDRIHAGDVATSAKSQISG